MSNAKDRQDPLADMLSDFDDLDPTGKADHGDSDTDFLADLDAILMEDGADGGKPQKESATDLDDLESFLDDFEKQGDDGGKPAAKAPAAAAKAAAPAEDDGLAGLFDEFDEPSPAPVAGGGESAGDGDGILDFDDLFADAAGGAEAAPRAAAKPAAEMPDALADFEAQDFDLSFDEPPAPAAEPKPAAKPAAAAPPEPVPDEFEELHILDEEVSAPSAKPAKPAASAADDDNPFLDQEFDEPSIDFESVAPTIPAQPQAKAAPPQPQMAAPADADEQPATITPIEPAALSEQPAEAASGGNRGGTIAALALAVLGLGGAGGAGYVAYDMAGKVETLERRVTELQGGGGSAAGGSAMVELSKRVDDLAVVIEGPMSHLRHSNEQMVAELSQRVASLESMLADLRHKGPVAAASEPPPARPAPAPAAERPAPPERPQPAAPPAAPTKPAAASGAWSVNLLSLNTQRGAEQERDRLRRAGVDADVQKVQMPDGKVWYRVRVGGFDNSQAARDHLAQIKRKVAVPGSWVGKD